MCVRIKCVRITDSVRINEEFDSQGKMARTAVFMLGLLLLSMASNIESSKVSSARCDEDAPCDGFGYRHGSCK